MALSKSLPKGQFPVLCNLCEKDNKISWKCIDCDLLMCINCKERIHIKIKNSRNHKVISTKDIGNQTEQLDLSNIQCREHKDQVSCMFCKSCDRLVCPLCISNVHNGHGLVDIKQGYKIKTERLQKGQGRVIANSDILSKTELKIKEISKAEHAKYTEANDKLQAHVLALKHTVDQHAQKLKSELNQKWENFKRAAKTDVDRIKSLQNNQADRISLAQEILNSNDAEQIFDERTELEKSLLEELEPLKLDFTSLPIFVPGNIVQRNVGSLQNTTPENITLNVLKEYTTDISKVLFMSPCEDSLWIADNDKIQKVQPELNALKVVSSFDKKVYGIAVSPSNDLLVIPEFGMGLKKMNTRTAELYDTVYSIDPLTLQSVHVTRDNKVVMGGKNSKLSRAAVIIMDAEGKHKTKYEYDENNQPIFRYPLKITSTRNRNIFVVDEISDDAKGRVVVLGQDGDVINLYTGHPEINTKKKPFKPASVVTTPLDNIIVTDLDTEILHILNNEGHFITHINARDFGIGRPFTFAFTTSGNVYIGCTIAKVSTDNAKLYQVKMSGC